MHFIFFLFFQYGHILGDSVYPFLMMLNMMSVFSFFVLWFNFFLGSKFLFFCFLVVFFFWFKDVFMENLSGMISFIAYSGLKFSFLLFLFSEVMFFFSVFWCYFDSALVPNVELGYVWPSFGVLSPSFSGLPLLNTLFLISSGVTVTWSHFNLLSNKDSKEGLFFTCFLAFLFLLAQLFEYYSLSFSLSDSIFGSIFFFSTGFHGIHVMIGMFFLFYCLVWFNLNSYNILNHLSFECAILYWHFVDVVWLFLFLFVYYWGQN